MSPEAEVGEILVRVGLSLTAIGIAIAALIIAIKTKAATYPARLAREVSQLDADVHKFDLKISTLTGQYKSLRASFGAEAQRMRRAAGLPAVPAVAPGEPDPDAITQEVWESLSPMQRDIFAAQGFVPVGANGGATPGA